MTLLTQTITNSITMFGIGPTTKWGTAVFGTSKWGEGSEDLGQVVIKQIDNSVSPDTTVNFKYVKGINETLTFDFEGDFEGLYDGIWGYVFTKPTNDNDERNVTTWVDDPDETSGWSLGATETDNWG